MSLTLLSDYTVIIWSPLTIFFASACSHFSDQTCSLTKVFHRQTAGRRHGGEGPQGPALSQFYM